MEGSAGSSKQALIEEMRTHIVTRLLTTQEDGSGSPRRDISVFCFGDFELCRHHRLDTVDLLVASGLQEDTFYDLVKERLSSSDPWNQPFVFSKHTKFVSPCEIRISSSIFVRIWYKCSESLSQILYPYRTADKWFLELSDLPNDDVNKLDLALGKGTNSKFRSILWKSLSKFRGEDSPYEPGPNRDINNVNDHVNMLASLKVCFDRRIPRFDITEALEIDKKMAICAKDLLAERLAGSYQPLRWRTKANPDRLVYFIRAPQEVSSIEVTEKIREQLGAVSVEYSPNNTHKVLTNDVVADFNFDYEESKTRIVPSPLFSESTSEVASRGPFPDAEKAYKRIRWDAAINERNIEIHYEDRHAGIMVKPFGEWVAITEEEDFVPMHRIRSYVRVSDGRVLWDRSQRINRLGQA